jgi:hypothetical protein
MVTCGVDKRDRGRFVSTSVGEEEGPLDYSCAMKGFEISSSPSTGLSKVIVGPRITVRPSMRIRGSGTAVSKGGEVGSSAEERVSAIRTLNLFLHFVKDKVEQLVVSLEHASHCLAQCVNSFVHQLLSGKEKKNKKVKEHRPSRPPVNLTRMRALAYLARSRIASRLGLSSVGCGPCGPPWR